MQVDEIRRLVKLVEESQIDELEVRRWWTVVRIHKRGANHKAEAPPVAAATPAITPVPVPAPPPLPPETKAPAPSPTAAAPATSPAVEATPAEEGLITIRSPMVGTFYRSPNPTLPPYVEEGSRVAKGQAVCIVEAMKLMNEIEAEIAGTVVRILVENGKSVEFNQPLFLVRPS